jgi:uncharacterized damage-inducible protein DinB
MEENKNKSSSIMNEIKRIKNQLSRTFDGESWTGPSVMEVLKDVEPGKAASRPIPEAHSIWELAEHMNSTIENVIRRLKGDFSQFTDEEDWPKVTDTSKKSWDDLISRLKASHSELLSEVSKLSQDILEKPMKEGFSSYYLTLHGLVQHNQYHLGQISILKKGYFSTEGMMSH